MEILIKEQFCGPPGTGNGGYVCGRLAKTLDTWPVEITLLRPIPVEIPLVIKQEGDGASLYREDDLLASARPVALDLEAPAPPVLEEAREAAKGFLGFHRLAHPYKRCFVCGPAREACDGMRIFAGPLEGGKGAATVWTPEDWQTGGDGEVDVPFILGALDCPGYFSMFPEARHHALLGRMTVEVSFPLEAGEDYIVYGWPVAAEGKKHFVGTGLFDAKGRCLARALSIWFTVS